MGALPETVLAALAGLLGGMVLGLAARRGRFCTLGAIEDALYGQDWTRIRMWAMALAVAIAGVFALDHSGQIGLGGSIYGQVAWNPLAGITGGLLFGYGMALAGNCGYGALARAGGGDLRSFVLVLVMGISAYMAIGGPTALIREALFPTEAGPGDFSGVAHAIGDLAGFAPMVPAFAIAAALLGVAMASRSFRDNGPAVLWSLAVGLAIISGWWATSYLSATGFGEVRPGSHSYTAPLGESLIYLMTSTGGGLSFGIGSVAGVLVGAFAGSFSKGHFRWEACDDAGELGRQIFGAVLMGTGGVTALGCSVGQGLTAFAALSWSAPVTLAAIFAGAALGLRQLIAGFNRDLAL